MLNGLYFNATIPQGIETTPQEVNEALKSSQPPRLIDVRTMDEWNLAKIKNAQLNNEELAAEIMKWPKNTAIVFFCHHGQRSLDAASQDGIASIRVRKKGAARRSHRALCLKLK